MTVQQMPSSALLTAPGGLIAGSKQSTMCMAFIGSCSTVLVSAFGHDSRACVPCQVYRCSKDMLAGLATVQLCIRRQAAKH
jgi:hypothetical protein